MKEVGAGVTLWANAFRALESIGLAGEVLRLAGGFTGGGVKRRGPGWHLPVLLRQLDLVIGRP